jgi:hypothetical protein
MIRIVPWFTWLLVFGWACAAHASPVPPSDPVWSTDRIARLPSEVRERVLSACGPPARAGHYFATYDPTRTPSISTTRFWNAPTCRASAAGSAGSTRPSSDAPEYTSRLTVKRMFDARPPASTFLAHRLIIE